MVEFLVDRKRTALAILVVLIFAGIFGRINIPIENEPVLLRQFFFDQLRIQPLRIIFLQFGH
jgi:hypothetical protein